MPIVLKRSCALTILAGLAAVVPVFIFCPGLAGATVIVLAWDPNTEPDLGGYLLYLSHSPAEESYFQELDMGMATQSPPLSLRDDLIYYFWLKAYNTKGIKSGRSNIIRYPVLEMPFKSFLPIIQK
jgi:hypothetical protein